MGSHAISTRPPFSARSIFSIVASGIFSVVTISVGPPLRPRSLVAGLELGALRAPFGLLVRGPRGDRSQRPDRRAVQPSGGNRRDACAGGLVHERHELVGEARHRAGDANAADVRTAADAVHPAALGDVAVDHRAPAADFNQALRRTILVGEVGLLVVAGAVATLMDGLAEQP